MRTAQILLYSFLFIAFSLSSYGQDKSKQFIVAEVEYDNEGFHEAADLYKTAYEKEDDLERAAYILFRIGECYRQVTQNENAEEYYKKALTARYHTQDPIVFYRLGEVMLNQQRYDEAVEQFNSYAREGGDQGKADMMIEAAEKAAEQFEDPESRYIVENEILLNTEYFDFSPAFSDRRLEEIVFSSSRPSAQGDDTDPKTGNNFMDLFSAKRDKKGKWSTPVPLNSTVNTKSNEGTGSFDSRMSDMYFTRCEFNDDGRLPCKIYKAQKRGNDYGVSELVPMIDREQDDSSHVGNPWISPDDEYMIFVSNMPGGQGGRDLWMATYDRREDVWTNITNLGPQINTADDERFPYIREDGTLYFASNGHDGGLGGLDIYEAEATGDREWGNVKNMGYPINTAADDYGIIFEGEEDKGLFTSSRDGGKGLDDIYSFKMPPLEFCLQATVYDDETAATIPNARVIVNGSDGSSFELTTDENGGFSLCDGEIKPETNYTVDVSKENYIGTGDQFSTVGLSESTTFAREYFIQEIRIDKEYTFPTVLYPFNKANLLVNDTVNSPDSLQYLVDLLEKNPTLVINLEAHTDTRGSASYNQELSQRRAQTCVDYLIDQGIDKARLYAVGKGEEEPKITDKQISAMATEEAKEAAHQKNRRTVFTIRSNDYVPPQNN
ncbi:OmpA family protein [Halocola ammonii]